MTLADFIIVSITGVILFLILYQMFKHKDEDVCKGCAYAKKCTDDCKPKK
jgi:uncharacterized membrane protein YuzA (DUF378 family)